MTNELTTIPPLQKALALAVEAGDVDAIQDVRATATALQKGARARGMGVEAENAAAEVVLRAERAIGLLLLGLKNEGKLAGPGNPIRQDNDTHIFKVVELLRQKPLEYAAINTAVGQDVRAQLSSYPFFVKPRTKGGKWTLDEVAYADWLAGRDRDLVTLADLGINAANSRDFQSVAKIGDDMFERMLNEAKNLRERIAKVNFYRKPADPKKEGPATKDESGWNEFQRGANTLLGWHVDEDGQGRFTKNGLLQLPNDQLHTLAVIVQELVRCYQEAKGQR